MEDITNDEKCGMGGGGYLLPHPPIIYIKFNTNFLRIRDYSKALFDHMNNTAFYTALICEALNLDEEEMELFITGALLHDVGKTKISNDILNKKGPLSPVEWLEIKRHPIYGVKIVSDEYKLVKDIIPIVRYHHERFDGKGYFEVKGKSVPLGAKIVSIADAFDAMYTIRPYRNPWDFKAVIKEIYRCSGTQFDPYIVQTINNYYGFYDGNDVNINVLKEIIERGKGWINRLLEWNIPFGYVNSFSLLLDRLINEYYVSVLFAKNPR